MCPTDTQLYDSTVKHNASKSGHTLGPHGCLACGQEPEKALQSQAGYLSTSIQGPGHLHTPRVVFLPWQCLQNSSGANTTCTKRCAVPLRLSCVLAAFLTSCLENPIPYKNHSSLTNLSDIPDLKEVTLVTMGQLFNKICLERFYWLL